MQDVNNDMDELFRRAAHSYPLNTEGANWDKVLNALHAEENVEAEKAFTIQNIVLNVLLLLVLLALPLFVVDYSFVNNNKFFWKKIEKNNEQLIRSNTTTASKGAYQKSFVLLRSNRRGEYYTNIKSLSPDIVKGSTNETNVFRHGNNTRNKGVVVYPFENSNKVEDVLTTKDKAEGKKQDSTNFKGLSPVSQKDFKTISDTIVSSKSKAKKETGFNQIKDKRLYAGLLAGPDFSTIKFQTVNKTGFSAGLLLGYVLNRKVAIETGILWDKKLYYTDGKYFYPKNVSIPSSINIDDVNGSCSMVEWSVDFSYNIKSYKKSFLTAYAGISSYFMKNENYSYTFQRNGIESEWSLGYRNSSANLFSVINVGVSYNHNMSRAFGLRMQPYVKIPVRDIGMGRLPITSAGVYVILTKRIL